MIARARWPLNDDESIESLIARLRELHADLRQNPDSWENHTLADYLESTAAWLEATKDRAPAKPSWSFVAGLFAVGKVYE
jgi:hypothetical protein